ncbi:MAG: OmpA family protein [Bacteroidota bacterium]
MKRIAAILILFAFSTAAFAQSKREWLEYGDAAFKNEDYHTAAAFYLKVIDKKTSSSTDVTYPYETKPYTPPPKKNKDSLKAAAAKKDTDLATKDSVKTNVAAKDTSALIVNSSDVKVQYVTHQIAESYRLNRNYADAVIWYKKSMDNKPLQYPYEGYWYGDALMKMKRYPAAQMEFEKIMDLALAKKDSAISRQAQLKMAGCFLATDTANTKKQIIVTELDSLFNKQTASFAINYFGDQNTVQFTAAREGSTVTDPKLQQAKFICDLYTLQKKDSVWGNLKKIEIPANTDAHEGTGFLTLDRSSYFFTRWSTTNKNECAIYTSKMMSDKWFAAEKMNEHVNVEGYKSMHPALTSDANTLYFSSNRPGGYGKMDIWYVTLDDAGKVMGPPKNLGPNVNTPEDEVTPFYHNFTSSIFFSSEGHPGFGGLDIFNTSLSDDSLWQKPRNLGSPVNSSKDDAYYILERSQQHGFLTSDRKECADCPSGACYRVYSVDKEPNVYNLSGVVYNAETNEVIANALITFKDIRGDKEEFFIITDANGYYSTPLNEGMELYIKAQKNKFFGDAGNISTTGLTESQNFEKDFFLSLIPQGEIVIPGIEYDYDKATLRPASKKILDDLTDFLNLNNNLSIEISSHTDERGSDKYNLRLSQERAKSVVDYLIEKGIAPERLLAQGYGETRQLVLKAKTEEEHQKNRRTAFRPIKEGEIRSK